MQPRTETTVTLPAPIIAENSSILINTHKITEDVLSGNCVVTIRNQTVFVSIINHTENYIEYKIISAYTHATQHNAKSIVVFGFVWSTLIMN